HERPLGLAMPARENLDHVDPIQRKLETRSDSLHRKAFAAARNAHEENPFGHDLFIQAVAQLEKLAAIQQPLLQSLQTADFGETRAVGHVLDETRAIHKQP